MKASAVRRAVRRRYAALAERSASCCGTDAAPPSLGCGFPLRRAALRTGETVLDLGSGAGGEAIAASRAVGPGGHVIGVDMTPEMIAAARRRAAREGADNVEFLLGNIEALPLPDGSVDAAISNCVINLAPDKAGVFKELYRVLKPGGRFVISDMVTRGKVPEAVHGDPRLWSCCVGGALPYGEYLSLIRAAGFYALRVTGAEDREVPEGGSWRLLSVTVEARKP